MKTAGYLVVVAMSIAGLAALGGCLTEDEPLGSVSSAIDGIGRGGVPEPSPTPSCWTTLQDCSTGIFRGTGHNCTCTSTCLSSTCSNQCDSLYLAYCGSDGSGSR